LYSEKEVTIKKITEDSVKNVRSHLQLSQSANQSINQSIMREVTVVTPIAKR
jgi:hypothetical protein